MSKTTAAPAKKAAGPAANHPPALRKDPQHPEVHPERHPASGATELPTAGGAEAAGNVDTAGAGAMQASVDPQPSIGTTHDPDRAKSSPAVHHDDEDEAEYVFSYEQALTLPVVDKGTPQKAPSEAKVKALHKQQRAAGSVERTPITFFKDADRRTMVVVKTADGLAAMPSKDFKDVDAPNAAQPA